jgi:phospholipid/cholesterol/gamma-HCH transport system substrate-binding protein
METRAHYVAVGAFVLAMVVLAFVAVLWLGRAELTTQFAYYDINFEGVTGLSKGAPVNYTGVPIGRVSAIKLDPDKQVRVTIEIDSDVEIRTNDRASLETNILSGVSYIEIGGGTKEAKLVVAEPGERYPMIRARRTGIKSLVARAPQILEKLETTLDEANELLDENNRKAFAAILENARVFSSGLIDTDKHIDQLADNANTTMVAATTLIGNIDRAGGLREQATTAVTDFDTLAKNLTDTNRQLQLTLQDVRPGVRNFSQQTLSDVGALVNEARQLISGLTRLTAEIERDPSRVLFGDRREGYRPK